MKPFMKENDDFYNLIYNELVELFGRLLHSIDLAKEGVVSPSEEQLEGWRDKYLSNFSVTPTSDQAIRSNLFYASVNVIAAYTLHVIREYEKEHSKNHQE